MFNIVIDRILNAAKETTILDYNNVVNLLIKKTYNKKENMTNSQMEEISKNALNFIHKNIILYQTSYEINTKFLSKLLEIINITSEDSVRILLTDYYYKVIFINGRIENDVIENNFIVDSTKLNSNNNLSEEDIVEKTKNLFYELIDISDDKHKDNFYAAYSIIIFTYLNTCLELLNINTIEKMENEFNFEIYEALSDELKNSIAENHKILRDIFSNVKNNKRKIKRWVLAHFFFTKIIFNI